MKVALVIAGQLRTHNICKHNIKAAVIDKYDTDVFLSINPDNTYQTQKLNDSKESDNNNIQEAISFYNPCEYYICKSYDKIYEEDIKKLNINDAIKLTSLKNYRCVFEQYYIIKEGYALLLNYIKKTGIEYDVVIRMRFDNLVLSRDISIPTDILYKSSSEPYYIRYNTNIIDKITDISKDLNICLDIPPLNGILTTNYYNMGKESWADAYFLIHSSKIIPIMYNYYDELFSIINIMTTDGTNLNDVPFYEIWFYRFLQMNNIKLLKTDIMVLFCREEHT